MLPRNSGTQRGAQQTGSADLPLSAAFGLYSDTKVMVLPSFKQVFLFEFL